MNLELLGPPKPSSTSSRRSSAGRTNYILPSSSQGSSFSKSSQSHSRNPGRIPELSLVNASALLQDETLSQPSSSQRAKIPLADQIRNVEARRGFGVSISSTSLTTSSSHTSSSTFHRTNPARSLQFQTESNDEVISPNHLMKSSTTKQPPKKTTDQNLFARFEEEMRVAGAAIATPKQPSIETTLSLSLKSASIEDNDDHLLVADPSKNQRPLQPISPSPSPPFIHQALEKEEKKKGKEEEEDSVSILPMMTEEDESEPCVLDVKKPEKVNQLEDSETQKEASALLSEMEQLFETDEKQTGKRTNIYIMCFFSILPPTHSNITSSLTPTTVFPHLSALRHSSTSASHDSSHLRSSDSSGGRHRHISRSELENDESSQRHFGDAGTSKSSRRRINPFGQNEEPPSQEDGEEEEGGKRKEELLSLDIRIRYTDLGETSPGPGPGPGPGPDRGGGKRKTPPMSTTTSATTPTKLNSNTSKRICIELSDEEETHNNTRRAPVPNSPGVLLGRKGGAGTGTGTGTGARKLNSTTTSTSTSNATTPNTSTRNSPISVATTTTIPTTSSSSSKQQQPKVGGRKKESYLSLLSFRLSFILTLSCLHFAQDFCDHRS
jgi:hypothetical protein